MRLEEKEQILTKKTKQLQDLGDEKSTLTGETRDMKDMLDVKERKVNVLQKKVHTVIHASFIIMQLSCSVISLILQNADANSKTEQKMIFPFLRKKK